MQDEGVIDCTQILWIGRDDVPIALPCADRNRDIDDIDMARPAAQQANRAGCQIIQGDNLRTLVAKQHRDARLPRSAPPRLRNHSRGNGNFPFAPVDLVQQSLHAPAPALDRDEGAGVEGNGVRHSAPSARRAHA